MMFSQANFDFFYTKGKKSEIWQNREKEETFGLLIRSNSFLLENITEFQKNNSNPIVIYPHPLKYTYCTDLLLSEEAQYCTGIVSLSICCWLNRHGPNSTKLPKIS